MDNHKKMAEKVETIPIEDILPDFDKEKVWQKLQPRLPQRRHIFSGYRTYAAAVVGILIALGAYLLWPRQNDIAITRSTKTNIREVKREEVTKLTPSIVNMPVPAMPKNNKAQQITA